MGVSPVFGGRDHKEKSGGLAVRGVIVHTAGNGDGGENWAA